MAIGPTLSLLGNNYHFSPIFTNEGWTPKAAVACPSHILKFSKRCWYAKVRKSKLPLLPCFQTTGCANALKILLFNWRGLHFGFKGESELPRLCYIFATFLGLECMWGSVCFELASFWFFPHASDAFSFLSSFLLGYARSCPSPGGPLLCEGEGGLQDVGGQGSVQGPSNTRCLIIPPGLVPSLGHLYWLDPFFGGKMCEMKKATHLTAGSLISLKSQVYVSPKAGLRFFSLLYPWDDESDIFLL